MHSSFGQNLLRQMLTQVWVYINLIANQTIRWVGGKEGAEEEGGGEEGEEMRVKDDMLKIEASTDFQLCFQFVLRVTRSRT